MDILLVVVCIILGLVYALLCYLLLESERGAIKGEAFTKAIALFYGGVAGYFL